MNRFEDVNKPLRWLMAILLAAFLAGCGDDNEDVIQSSDKAIAEYSLEVAPGTLVAGTIDQLAMTISVPMPDGTDVTALVATCTTTGVTVKVGTTVQQSGVTPNDFTNPVVYTVTAANGTTATYTVALAKKDLAENACLEIKEKFSAKHPELPSRVFVADTGDGLFSSNLEKGPE